MSVYIFTYWFAYYISQSPRLSPQKNNKEKQKYLVQVSDSSNLHLPILLSHKEQYNNSFWIVIQGFFF